MQHAGIYTREEAERRTGHCLQDKRIELISLGDPRAGLALPREGTLGAAALSAAREGERKRWEDHAKSYFDGWEDGEGFPLADTFIAALSPEGSTEGGE
jgi:hypothetical protein